MVQAPAGVLRYHPERLVLQERKPAPCPDRGHTAPDPIPARATRHVATSRPRPGSATNAPSTPGEEHRDRIPGRGQNTQNTQNTGTGAVPVFRLNRDIGVPGEQREGNDRRRLPQCDRPDLRSLHNLTCRSARGLTEIFQWINCRPVGLHQSIIPGSSPPTPLMARSGSAGQGRR